MGFDAAVAIAVGVFIVGVWLLMGFSWGFVYRVDSDGFVMRTILNTKRFIAWESVEPRVRQFSSFLPRVIVRMKNARFLQLHRSFAILLRKRPLDATFLEEMRRRFNLAEIERLGDLFR